MGYTYSFVDNEVYGTDDINAAISRLTTAGVAVYPTDETLINAMNSVTAQAASEGIEFSAKSCLVSVEDEDIKISAGTAFFEDGVSMVIDSEGTTLPLETGVYVYLFRDVNRNSCYPCVSKELPESGYILLAEIDENGSVTDKRTYAASKLAPNSAPQLSAYSMKIVYYPSTSPDEAVATLDAGYSAFTHLFFRHKEKSLAGVCDLAEGDYSEYVWFCDGSEVRFKKIGPKVEVYVLPHGDYAALNNVEIFLV